MKRLCRNPQRVAKLPNVSDRIDVSSFLHFELFKEDNAFCKSIHLPQLY